MSVSRSAGRFGVRFSGISLVGSQASGVMPRVRRSVFRTPAGIRQISQPDRIRHATVAMVGKGDGMSALSAHPQRSPILAPTRPVLIGIAVATICSVGYSIGIAVASGTPALYAALIYWISVSYTASGLIAWRQRPSNRFGPLMIVTGLITLATTLSWADGAVPRTIGQAVDLLPLVLIVHVFLAFPTGRLRRGWTWMLVTTGYVAAIGAQLVVMMLGGPGSPSLLTVSRSARRGRRSSQHRTRRDQCDCRGRVSRLSASGSERADRPFGGHSRC